jgi:hypothetical protein
LFIEKQFSKMDSKILSCKWNDKGSIFFTGHSNGNIIKWDYLTGQVLLTLTTNKDTVVWSLCYINEKLIASGDSKGSMKMWDSQFGILKKEFDEHNADILTICYRNNTIYYTGSDSLISTVQNTGNDWILTSKFRGQSHDIHSICLLNDDCLLSGGLTTDICLYKLSNYRFIEKYDKKLTTSVKRHISAFEHKPKISFSYHNGKLFILHRKLESLNLWLVDETNMESVLLLAELNKKSDSNIIAAGISKRANYIAYSDNESTVLFKYGYLSNEIKKLKRLKFSSRFIYFNSEETNLICINQSQNIVYLYNINNQTIKNTPLATGDVYISCDYLNDKLALSTIRRTLILIDLKNESVDANYPHPDSYVTQIKFISSDQLLAVSENNRYFNLYLDFIL